jgi:hypothetical protein
MARSISNRARCDQIAGRAGGGAVFTSGGSAIFALLLLGAAIAFPRPASALPSFARQTGQPCSSCHTAFPQLKPFGRAFKLGGYTLGGTRSCGGGGAASGEAAPLKLGTEESADAGSDDRAMELLKQIPIAGMTVPNFTHIKKGLPADDTPKGFDSNDNAFVQETSIFYGGQIVCNLGAFVQGTYERPGSSFFLDNTDIRYADQTKLGGMDLTYGITANNNPTVQDPWNTTPTWSYPFIGASDELAPTPAAGTMIEGTFEGRVAGVGAYIWANNMFYLEGTAYGTFGSDDLSALGLDPTDPQSRFDGLAPYWRAAFEKDWSDYSFEVGTFGMYANVAPLGNQSAPTDQVTDVGFDTQFQYFHDVHAVTARFTYIFQHQKNDGSQPMGLASNASDDLDSLKVSGEYVYNSVVSFNVGYFNLSGDADALLYADSSSPASPGSPNSNGWVFDVAWLPWSNGGPKWWPWLNTRLGVSYTHYNEFNGASSNYDGNGRNASDNDTTYVYAWTAF